MTESLNIDYFKLLMETQATANMLARNLTEYFFKNRILCNVNQVIILHLLREANCTLGFTDISDSTKYISTNISYNLKCLIDRGHVFQSEGEHLTTDKRCSFYDITKKGIEIYERTAKYVSENIDGIKRTKGWEQVNFDDYMCDLKEIQEYLRGT
jgi:DNA-binding MarR family transcriptional regulator